jgi:hypothetical protein
MASATVTSKGQIKRSLAEMDQGIARLLSEKHARRRPASRL